MSITTNDPVGDRPCPLCGESFSAPALTAHLENAHDRDGGSYNPPPEVKVWPPSGIETK